MYISIMYYIYKFPTNHSIAIPKSDDSPLNKKIQGSSFFFSSVAFFFFFTLFYTYSNILYPDFICLRTLIDLPV